MASVFVIYCFTWEIHLNMFSEIKNVCILFLLEIIFTYNIYSVKNVLINLFYFYAKIFCQHKKKNFMLSVIKKNNAAFIKYLYFLFV